MLSFNFSQAELDKTFASEVDTLTDRYSMLSGQE